jgi:hypothetical protein
MDECIGPGATHHHACACREAYIAKLERVAEAAREYVAYATEYPLGARRYLFLDDLRRALDGGA